MRLGVALRTASMEDRREALREALKRCERHVLFHVMCHEKVHVQSKYARHGKMNKRCLFTVFAFENISLDSTLNPKLYIYISY